MAGTASAEDLELLQRDLYERIRELIHEETRVSVGWWNEEGATTNWDLLVEIALDDPGEDKTWDQDLTREIRTLVRERTAELVPTAVATTRVVTADKDG